MPILDRRTLLKGSAAAAGAFALGGTLATRSGAASAAPLLLKPQYMDIAIAKDGITPKMMTYGLGDVAATGMPPVLRMKKGEAFNARLVNGLDEPTTVHWHGLRIVNSMDGVPEMTQPYVYPGDSFDYAFTPPDAGTFWYHPHCNTLTQMGHGLTGVIVVENPADPVFDAEVVLNLRDFRLGAGGAFIAPFKPRDAARGGTYGTLRTVNWKEGPQYDAPSGGLVRVRMAATDVTRIYTLGIDNAAALVVALDGNTVEVPYALDRLDFGPGQRVELIVRMPDDEGAIVSLGNFRGTTPFVLATLRATGASLKRDLRAVTPLPANDIAVADLTNAQRIPLEFTASSEHTAKTSICGTLGYTFWAINTVPWDGDATNPDGPLGILKLGKSYVLQVRNRTPHAHPIHLHGLTFRIISSNMRTILPPPTDTILLQPDEMAELALVADNPGDWMLHCHIIEHQKSGMSGFFRVA